MLAAATVLPANKDSQNGAASNSFQLAQDDGTPSLTKASKNSESWRWLGSLKSPTEIPSDLLSLSSSSHAPGRLSRAPTPPARNLARLKTVVIPSLHKRTETNSPDPVSPGFFGDLPGDHGSIFFSGSRPSWHRNILGLSDKKVGRGRHGHGNNMSTIFGPSGLRIAIMGATGCGKTALVNRFIEGTFKEEYYPTTESRYRKTINLDAEMCNLEIYDTSGNFKQREAHYCSICHGFILVFDVTDPASFDKLRDIKSSIERVRTPAGTPFIIVGTQADKDRDLDKCLYQEYMTQARQWGCEQIFFVSATSPRCVNIFYMLVRHVRDHYLPLWAEDYKPFEQGGSPSLPDSPRSMSVKSAPAGKANKRGSVSSSKSIQRSQSLGNLLRGEKESPSWSRNGILGMLSRRTSSHGAGRGRKDDVN